jgi:cytochrome P450
MQDEEPLKADWDVLETPAADLAETLLELREKCPLPYARMPGSFGYWSLVRYADVVSAARNTATFANATSRLAQRRVPLESDAPEHAQIRRLMQPFFMPATLARFEPLSRQYATELLDRALACAQCDAVSALARPLPPQILLSLLGQPREDWEWVKDMSESVYLQMSADPTDQARFKDADERLWDYSRTLVAEH